MLREKILSPRSKVKTFLEVNFYQVLLYPEIRQAQHLPTEQIKMERA